jgi:hypothetical protein
VNHHLNVILVGHRQAAIDRRWCGSPILMKFQRAGTSLDHFDKRFRLRGIALACQADVHRPGIERLDHPLNMPGTWRACGREGAMGWTGTTADHRGDAGY